MSLKKCLSIGLTVLAISFSASANSLSPFTSDGCSAYPDGVPVYDSNRWVHCCMSHDIAYWIGGPKKLKEEADLELNRCVSEVSPKLHGRGMQIGVQLGGLPNDYLPWAWGYGWQFNRGFRALSDNDKEEALQQFDSILWELLEKKAWLDQRQKGYIIARYELLRHELALDTGKDYYDKSVNDIEERYRLIRRIYQ